MRVIANSPLIIIVVIFVVAALLLIASPANSAPDLSKAIRPTVNPGGGGGSGGGAGGGGGGAGGGPGNGDTSADLRCASLEGQMINWGSGGEGGVTAELRTGSWQISTVSATDGNYGFGGLGIGVATFHIALTPEQDARFQSLIQDADIYLNCEFPIIANIALANNITIDPPVTIEMSASRTVIEPGQSTDITLTINNGLPNEITNVVVTDLFAPGLIPIDIVADVEPSAIKIVDGYEAGKLVAVNLDKVAMGAEVTIDMTVAADAEFVGTTEFRNTATLFYRESVAHQASLEFTVRGGALIPAPLAATVTTTAPVTSTTPEADSLILPTPEPTATVVPSSTIAPTETISPTVTDEAENGEDFVPPNGLPSTGGDFLPPPELLPITGQIPGQISNQLLNRGLNPLLPLSGLGFAGLTFMLYQWRAVSHRNKRRKKREEEQRAQTEDEPTPDSLSAHEVPIQTNEARNQEEN